MKAGIMIRTKTRECGSLKFDPKCNVCGKTNYPMAGWDIEGDDSDDAANTWVGEEAWICLDCIEELGFDLHHYEEGEDE